ncbi:type VI secretion system baseplate subunit TssG [Sutterella sp.]|uniref:type VI secretion system baseplate subunit TssG n=1 Tax=Sutterella sp. TaxID=1981025 RepID=UPI0026DF39BA|nr:type VI secretion system baseplate subunit TssG [Sutterella sp.]MDO5532391.1 type VI secretion system baseplate subunit TssG [Sutterella sp.]
MDDARKLIRSSANRLRRGEAEPDFNELVRRIENVRTDLPRVGKAGHLAEEPLRFGQEPYMRFPETSIARILPDGPNGELARLRVYFFGLWGVGGPMPLELTNEFFQRSHNHYDRAGTALADIIHHRLLALYYRAWAQNEEAVQFDRSGDDLTGNVVRAIAGLPEREKDMGLPHYAARAFTRFLSRMPRTADGLAKMLALWTEEKVRVEECVEGDYDIPADYRCRLGRREVSTLGRNMQIGRRYASRSRKMRVRIGPVDFERAKRFMPGTPVFDALHALVTLYLERPVDWELALEIRGGTVPRLALGRDAGDRDAAALGRGAALTTGTHRFNQVRLVLPASGRAGETV